MFKKTSLAMLMHQAGTGLAALLLLSPTAPAEIQNLIAVKWRALVVAAWWLAGVIAHKLHIDRPNGR